MAPRPSTLFVSIVFVFSSLTGARLFDDFPLYEVHSLRDHASIVVDNHLYIDGGSFATTDKSGDTTFQSPGRTLVVDLSQGWDAETIQSQSYRSGGAEKSGQSLFYDSKSELLYRYGGYFFGKDTLPGLDVLPVADPNRVWKPASVQPPPAITSRFYALAARTMDSLFLLGGLLFSNRDANTYQYLPGMIEYSTSDKKWTQIRSDDYLHGFGSRGQGVYLPKFGDEGVIVFLGGYDPKLPNPKPGETAPAGPVEYDGTMFPFANMSEISIYDIASKTFLSQTATTASGPPPRGRFFFCATLVEDSQSGGSDIYVHGGAAEFADSPAEDFLEAVKDSAGIWVLSLPSFQWSRVYDSPEATLQQDALFRHTCEVVNGGQLAIMGGDQAYSYADTLPIQIPVGPNIFDMTALEWRDGYDPNLGPYVRSKLLVDNIAKQPVPPQWNNAMLENIFMPKPTPSPSPSSSSNTGAIAGAAAGGAVALILAALLLWWFCFRKRKSGSKSQSIDDEAGTKPPAYRDVPGETLEKEPKAGATEVLQTPSSPTGTNLSDAGMETIISQNSQASELIAGPIPWRLPSGEYGGLSPNAEPVELMGTPTAFELSSASLRVKKAQRNEGNEDNERQVIE